MARASTTLASLSRTARVGGRFGAGDTAELSGVGAVAGEQSVSRAGRRVPGMTGVDEEHVPAGAAQYGTSIDSPRCSKGLNPGRSRGLRRMSIVRTS
jgi:hypothetical protein